MIETDEEIELFRRSSEWLDKESDKCLNNFKKNPTEENRQKLLHIKSRLLQWVREHDKNFSN